MFIHRFTVWHSKKTNGRLRSFLAKSYLKSIQLRNFFIYRDKDMFHFVNIELSRECNRRCSYCPLSKYHEFKKGETMDSSVFTRIIEQLEKINYSGYLCFTGYYEPLICKNLFKYVEYARKKLKRAEIVVYTNGDFLDKENLQRLEKNSVLLIITLHGDKTGERYRKLFEITKGKKVIFKRGIENYILSTRGSLVKVKNKEIQTSCILPSLQLTVDVEGKAILCFDDFFSEHVYGDVKKTDILQIWKGEKFKKTRNSLLRGAPKEEICQSCFSKETVSKNN